MWRFFQSIIVAILLIVLGTAIAQLITGCASYKYDDCKYERTVEKTLTCEGGKEGGTVMLPGNSR